MSYQPVPPDDPAHWSNFDHEELERLDLELVEHFGPRWGGLWIEPRKTLPMIGVALVDPTPEDVMWTEERARAFGWQISVCGTRYSETQLTEIKDRVADLFGTDQGVGLLSVGIRPKLGRVAVTFNEVVPETLRRVMEMVPAEVLWLEIRPGAEFRGLSADAEGAG